MSVSTAKTSKGKLSAKNTTQELLKDNPNRKVAYIANIGANKVYFAFGSIAVAEEGPFLVKETGTLTIPGRGDEGYTGPVSVITKEGESLLGYSEV